MKALLHLSVLTSSLLAATLSASVIFEETFENYSVGALANGSNANNSNLWIHSTSNSGYNVQADTMSYGSIDFGSHNLLITEDSTPGYAAVPLSASLQSSAQDLFIAFYLFAPASNYNLIGMVNFDNASRNDTYIGKNAGGSSALGLELQNGGNDNQNVLSTGTVMQVLARMNWGTTDFESMDLWVSTGGTTPNVATDMPDVSVTAGTAGLTFSQIAIHAGRTDLNSAGNQYLLMDNIRIATDATEAVKGAGAPPPIPEPSAAGLGLAVGLLGWAASRRRRA